MIISQIELNRIRIRDIMAAIKQDYHKKLYLLEQLELLEKLCLKTATENDVHRVERMFIERKLKIKYFPSQGKKKMIINGTVKVVPIDKIYGSKDA